MMHRKDPSKLKYYSFKIGSSKDNRKNWILYDWKLPAIDPRMAISMLFMSIEFMKSTRSGRALKDRKQYEMPSKLWAELFVRQIIEYEREYTPKRGYTIHRYKKLTIYNPQHFIKLLPDCF